MDNMLVIIIVCAAALYVGRRIYLAFTSKKSSCGCDSGCDCCELFDEGRCDDKKPEGKEDPPLPGKASP